MILVVLDHVMHYGGRRKFWMHVLSRLAGYCQCHYPTALPCSASGSTGLLGRNILRHEKQFGGSEH